MAHHLLICEKPSAATKIAYALGGKSVSRISGRLPFYRFKRGGETVTVVSALGHLYAPVQQGSGWSFPIFNLRWEPKGEKRVRLFLGEISRLAREADSFISACDYDIEGSLIAFMILRHACGGADAKAKRMKFSTLTKDELIEAYENASDLDLPVIRAGMVRHEIDWIFGVNVSRALMEAYSCISGGFEVLSAGRVQGPTLDVLCRREEEIELHVPDPFWNAEAEIEFLPSKAVATGDYAGNPILRKGEGEALASRCDGSEGYVGEVAEEEVELPAPYPFDLGGLQSEAYRVFGFQPWKTQKIAEKLYLEGLISYPRTSSQKLPPSIGYRNILQKLGSNKSYSESVEGIFEYAASGKGLWPRQGKKADPAHPAIYPTGAPPANLTSDAKKVYDLIARRFISTFGPPARKLRRRIDVRLGGGDLFMVTGEKVLDEGWAKHYAPYIELKSRPAPEAKAGDRVRVLSVRVNEGFTHPPPRFNQSTLIRFMEENGLGTKSTRAEILSTLYRRGYISGNWIRVTDLGLGIVKILRKHFPELTSVELTRNLEARMSAIEEGKEDYLDVLLEGAEVAKGVFERMIPELGIIGAEISGLVQKLRDGTGTIGTCPSCHTGQLRIVRSKKSGKRFVGCSNYGAGCNFSAPLPQRGKIHAEGRPCSRCGYPIVMVMAGWSKPWRLCINPNCPSKQGGRSECTRGG